MALTDEAILQIRELIASGELGPGSRLPPEQELATQLGLSRNSMREAVKALELARVLDVRRGDGTYVTSLEPNLLLQGFGLAVELLRGETLLEVIEVRRLLEPQATAIAASRITDETLERLRGHLDRMHEASGDAEQLVEQDAAFHDCVIAATGNQTLMSLLDGLSSSTIRARVWRVMIEERAVEQTLAQHGDIYAALARRDPELARATALTHVATSERWLREIVGYDTTPSR